MKKLALLFILSVGLLSCSSDDDEPNVDLELACKIEAPAEGATIDLAKEKSLEIKGSATINVGKIESVKLSVGDKEIADVTTTPFNYNYVFEEAQEPGNLKIKLTVTAQNISKSAEVNVILVKESDPEPELEEGQFVDKRDGKIYNSVKVGNQVWMAENLAYLPQVNRPMETVDNEGKPLFFVLDYDGTDVAKAKETREYKKLGVLYNWYAAMNEENATGGDAEANPSGIQGICPKGWHVPSIAEWKELDGFIQSQLPDVEGDIFIDDFGGKTSKLDCKNVWSAIAGGDLWSAPGNLDTWPDMAKGPLNTFKLNIVPVGQCYHTGSFGASDSSVSYWTTDSKEQGAGYISINNLSYYIYFPKFGVSEKRGFSVRCVKD